MTRRFILSIAAVLAIGACSDQQEPNTDGSTPGSEFASTSGSKSINVALKGPATAGQLGELAKYGNVKKQLLEINALFMSGNDATLASVRTLPFVAAANFDAERNAPPSNGLPAGNTFTNGLSTWNLDATNVTVGPGATRVATLPTGNGVYVAILDTGLLPTWRQYFPSGRIAVGLAKTFGGGASNGNVSEPPNKWEQDVNSHGTHVTSTVLGYSLLGTPINGVAPMVTIIPVKVLNQSGGGWSSAIAEGITYIGRLKQSGALVGKSVVINMSLGGSVLDAVERAAIDYAIREGVVIVASAGNSGAAGMGYPGAYEPVISVAASGWARQWTCNENPAAALMPSWWTECDINEPTNPDDFYIASFSSRELEAEDQDLDVVAPGSWVVGPYQLNQSGKLDYFYLSGTSMASPHVAGIVALMKERSANLTALQVEAKLEDAAIPMPEGCRNVRNGRTGGVIAQCWEDDATGHGLITADRALTGL